MRRGWILAGAVILAAVSSAPVAAAGVSLVLERANESGDDVGKWIRTGDVQRFRVRVNGMAKGVKVAVAASPTEALAEVACVPSAEGSPVPDPSPSLTASAAPGVAATGAVPTARDLAAQDLAARDVIARDLGERDLAVRALAVRALAGAGTSGLSDGARVCRLGRISGERSVDVTLTAPEGVRRVVLAAVAKMRAVSGEGLTTMYRTVATRVADAVPTISGHAAKLPDPTRPPAVVTPVQGAVGPQSAPAAGHEHSATTGREPGAGATAGRESGVVATARQEPSVAATAGRESDGARAGHHPVSETAGHDPWSGTAFRSGLILPQAIPPQAVPGASPSVLPSAAQNAVTASPAPGAIPSPHMAAPSATEDAAGTGVAPLPWEMVAATKRSPTPGGTNPLKGPLGHSLAVGAIAMLLAALWGIGTVQRHNKRRIVR
jgi:hypothetical protein